MWSLKLKLAVLIRVVLIIKRVLLEDVKMDPRGSPPGDPNIVEHNPKMAKNRKVTSRCQMTWRRQNVTKMETHTLKPKNFGEIFSAEMLKNLAEIFSRRNYKNFGFLFCWLMEIPILCLILNIRVFILKILKLQIFQADHRQFHSRFSY